MKLRNPWPWRRRWPRRRLRRPRRRRRLAQAKEQFIPGAVVPHRRLRAQRHAMGQRLCRLPQAGQCARRHQRREAHLRGMRDRLRHGRSVECYERLKGKNGGASLVQPLSTGATFAITEKAPGRQDPGGHRRLRPQRERRRHASSSGTSRSPAPTGSPPTPSCRPSPRRKAAWTSSRARRSRWSTTTARTARSRSRCCRSAPRCTASSCSCCR